MKTPSRNNSLNENYIEISFYIVYKSLLYMCCVKFTDIELFEVSTLRV